MSDGLVAPDGTYLETGWGPQTPEKDTLTRQAILAHASWSTSLAAALGRPHATTDRWAGGFVADQGAFSNFVVLLQPLTDPESVTTEIGALVPSTSPVFLVSPWPTPDLRRFGFGLVGHPPLMVRPAGPRLGTPSSTVDVEEVTDPETLAQAERLLIEAYPLPDLKDAPTGALFAPAMLSDRTRVWLGRVEGEPAAVASAHSAAGVTLVEFVAALPTARGKGVGSAVTWAATVAEPEQPAVLIASDDGRPVYERMGFLAVERWTAWMRPAAS